MLNKFKQVMAAVLLVALAAGDLFAASPKRELRSTWFTTVWGIDWPSSYSQSSQKAEMIEYLDGFEAINMTASCFQVRSMGDAMYPSEYAPWSSCLTGTRGTNPGWDPLAYFVEESHKRGLEAYVWLNPYRWSSSGSTTAWTTTKDKEWVSSGILLTNGSYTVFNPAWDETRQLIVNVVEEILDNYDVDGILFDDYFYPSGGTSEGTDAPDYDDYKASGTTLSIGDWRRANVNQMVKDVYDAIQAKRPDVRFGISPAGVSSKSASKYGLSSPSSYGVKASDWQYSQIYSDPLAWLAEGTIDFISPQCYWPTTHSTAPYEPLIKWWSYAAPKFGRHFYSSQESSDLGSDGELTNDTDGWSELNNQVLYNRQYDENNAPGTIFYSAAYINGPSKTGLGNYLKANAWSHKSLTPEITWKNGPVYGKVSNLAYSNGTLSWTETTNGNANIRYTVYAVPASVTVDAAKATDGDGFDVQYLQKVVYGGSYAVASDKQNNYWYAVCVYDGYGKEHEAAIVNYPDGESEKATLISPINGATASWNQTFTWSSISNATYVLEISENSNFSTIKYQQTGITSNSVNINLGDLESTTVYYWRILTAQEGKLQSVSDVATFKTTTRPAAPQTTLISPENGSNIESDFVFEWSAVDCEQYILEVSTSSDFATLKYSQSLTSTTHNMVISLLGKGTYYWRVITGGKTQTNTASAVRSFNITKVVVGGFEPGYSIMIDKDNDTYSQVGDITINSIWFRSVADDYKNITFGENGSLNRSFCVGNDYVYMTGRSENDSEASIYLRKYDQKTGELIADVFLGSEGQGSYYPCNTVVKDSNGNICIANLSLSASSTPIKLHLVNTETGALTEIASLTVSGLSASRSDHLAVTGDVVSGNFKVYQAMANTKNVVRWTYVNGSLANTEICTLQSLYPSSASSLGIAPRVLPIDDNSFFLVGGNTYFSRYTFASSGTMTDSFANNATLAPIGLEANGGTFFNLNGINYVVYPYSDYNSGAHTFNMVKADTQMSFKSMELMWNIPKDGIGAVNSATYQVDADYLPIDESRGILYLFSPGNGLCAYEIVDTSVNVNGIDEIKTNQALIISGNTIGFGEKAQSLAIYNISGVMVANESDVTSVEMNVPAGVYIIKALINDKIIARKIVVK